ncbi:MAG: CHRD domain-containing protein [Chloroflexota bacterium]|nr:CHRD domain-containing protein [Chloroflexota bacterium]
MYMFGKVSRVAFILTCMIFVGARFNVTLLSAQDGSAAGSDRPETELQSPIALSPVEGSDIGLVYEAFLSPHQEGGEEEDTPALIPPEFRSTAPSVPRAERTSRGHAVIQFTRDLSRAYVFLAVENVNPDEVVMLHLHCGRPGQLGPILIDFSLAGNINTYLADGLMSIEVTNEDIVDVINHAHGLVGQFTSGCPIVPGTSDKVVTIAGMEQITRLGELYFNLHTAGQVYFGDIRGQFYPAAVASGS